jgi:hypothetical protein
MVRASRVGVCWLTLSAAAPRPGFGRAASVVAWAKLAPTSSPSANLHSLLALATPRHPLPLPHLPENAVALAAEIETEEENEFASCERVVERQREKKKKTKGKERGGERREQSRGKGR